MFDSIVSILLRDGVPEVQHPMALADEPRAEHNVGPAFEDRLDKPRIFGGIVLEVGILHDDDIAGGMEAARAAPLPRLAG